MRLRSHRTLAAAVLAVAGVGLAGWVLWLSRADSQAPQAAGAAGVVKIGEVADVQIDGEISPGIYRGALGPAPRIDTAALGQERPISQTHMSVPRGIQSPAVLIGEPTRDPDRPPNAPPGSLFIHSQGADPLTRFLSIFDGRAGETMTCISGPSGGACSSGHSTDRPLGGCCGASFSEDPDDPVDLEWSFLPHETAVVAISDGAGQPLYWQRPVAGVSLWSLTLPDRFTLVFQALDADGAVLVEDRFAVDREQDFADVRK